MIAAAIITIVIMSIMHGACGSYCLVCLLGLILPPLCFLTAAVSAAPMQGKTRG